MTAPTRPRRGELTASAARYTARKLRTKPVDGSWQERAWLFYDETPEVRFAARWYSNAMGRALLFAGRRDDEGKVVPLPPDHCASQLVAEIAGGADGQAQLLGSFGPHLTVAGEGWIIVHPQDNRDTADWRVLSTQEVKPQGTKLVAEIDGEEVAIPGAEDDTAGRRGGRGRRRGCRTRRAHCGSERPTARPDRRPEAGRGSVRVWLGSSKSRSLLGGCSQAGRGGAESRGGCAWRSGGHPRTGWAVGGLVLRVRPARAVPSGISLDVPILRQAVLPADQAALLDLLRSVLDVEP